MATSSAPPPTTAARVPAAGSQQFGTAMNGTQRRVPSRPPNLPVVGDEPPADDQVEDDQADAPPVQQPVFTFPSPQGAQPGVATPTFAPMPANAPPGAVAPVITLQPGPNGPTIYNFVPTEPTTPPTTAPGTPLRMFGPPVTAPAPGMIQQPVQGTTPTTRPPGGR
jgi:hypothetical protein